MKKKATRERMLVYIGSSLLVLFLLFLLVVAVCFSRKEKKWVIELSSVEWNTKFEQWHKDPVTYHVEVLNKKEDQLYGTIDNMKKSSIYETEQLFYYDIKQKELIIQNYSYSSRIVDFVVTITDFYLVEVALNSDQTYHFKIVKLNRKTNERVILTEGDFNDFLKAPRILKDESELILLMVTNQDAKEFFSVSKLADPIEERFVKEGFLNKLEGDLIYQMPEIHYYQGFLYYTLVDSSSIQKLLRYEMATGREEILYENKDPEWTLYSYLKNEEVLYVQLSSMEDSQSQLLFLDKKGDKKTFLMPLWTFEQSFPSGKIVAHNEGNVWLFYDPSLKEVKEIMNVSTFLAPSYFLIEENKILVQKESGNFYWGYLKYQ